MSKGTPVFFISVFAVIGITQQAVVREQSMIYAKKASFGEFPYFAALSGCGAAILTDKWLVTAAHCVDRPYWNPGNIVLVGGENTTNSIKVKYKRVVLHPDYKYIMNIPINDIALIELEKKLKFSDKVKPVKIGGHTSGGSKFLFVGKGVDEAGNQSQYIKKMQLTRLTTEQCLAHIPLSVQIFVRPFLKELERVNICAKRIEDKPGICSGDSGSPLTYKNELVGLASYVGNKDCKKTRLNFFTNVPTYTSWIKSVTGLK